MRSVAVVTAVTLKLMRKTDVALSRKSMPVFYKKFLLQQVHPKAKKDPLGGLVSCKIGFFKYVKLVKKNYVKLIAMQLFSFRPRVLKESCSPFNSSLVTVCRLFGTTHACMPLSFVTRATYNDQSRNFLCGPCSLGNRLDYA